jgi:hypothetical protein
MVPKIKVQLLMKLTRQEVASQLPEVVVEMYPSLSLLPEAHPAGQVEVNPMHPRQGSVF